MCAQRRGEPAAAAQTMTTLITNRKATFNHEILETLDAGVELLGFEVKALRGNRGSLESAYVTVRGDEAFLMSASIPAYQPKNTPTDYDPERNRRLLLTKKEIASLAGNAKGLTIVPLSVYNVGRKIKVKLAIVRGKKHFDKRETIKSREAKRDLDRELKNR